MADCTDSEKPASGTAKSFPNERKTPSPVNQGKAGKRPHPALRATFPSQGKALRGAVKSCAKRKVCPCEESRRADVAPSAPFRGHLSHRERQDPHGYLPFCVCFGGSILHFPGNVQCLPQKEIRALVLKEQNRHPQQQLRVAGRVIQGQTEVPLHPANPVEHRVPVGKKHLAGFFQRAAAG